MSFDESCENVLTGDKSNLLTEEEILIFQELIEKLKEVTNSDSIGIICDIQHASGREDIIIKFHNSKGF